MSKYVPYQKCPICDGAGKQTIATGIYTLQIVACDVCKGEKIIPMHCIAIDQKKKN